MKIEFGILDKLLVKVVDKACAIIYPAMIINEKERDEET
jgi:hypothetical protein